MCEPFLCQSKCKHMCALKNNPENYLSGKLTSMAAWYLSRNICNGFSFCTFHCFKLWHNSDLDGLLLKSRYCVQIRQQNGNADCTISNGLTYDALLQRSNGFETGDAEKRKRARIVKNWYSGRPPSIGNWEKLIYGKLCRTLNGKQIVHTSRRRK